MIKKDPIVEEAVNFLRKRSSVGIKKYGTTLDENNKDDFLLHLQEELGDALNYIVKLRSIKRKEDLLCKELEKIYNYKYQCKNGSNRCTHQCNICIELEKEDKNEEV